MVDFESRDFLWTILRAEEELVKGTITAKTPDEAIRRVVEQNRHLQQEAGDLHIAKPTGDTGDTASATWGDLHIRVEPSMVSRARLPTER